MFKPPVVDATGGLKYHRLSGLWRSLARVRFIINHLAAQPNHRPDSLSAKAQAGIQR
jgi:hypothetical protein